MDSYYKEKSIVTGDGERVGRKLVKKFYSPFQEGRGYNFKYKSSMIKSYLGVELPECFNYNECGKIYRLSKHIYSDSNLLAKRTKNKIVPLSRQDVTNIIGVHRVNFTPFWNKVLKYKIVKPITLDGDEYFCFNPLYYNSTRYMPLYLFIAFQEELKDHVPGWVVEKYLEMEPPSTKK